jgi:heme-degrading monooxygenase HmoA
VAILSVGRIKGDADELAPRAKRVDAIVAPIARANGGIFHAIVRTDDGLMIVNLWESEEGRQRTADDPEVQSAAREHMAGVEPPQWEAYEVVRYEAR